MSKSDFLDVFLILILHWPESILAVKQSEVDISIELNSLDTSGLEMKANVFKQLIRCEEPIDRQKMIKKTADPQGPAGVCAVDSDSALSHWWFYCLVYCLLVCF